MFLYCFVLSLYMYFICESSCYFLTQFFQYQFSRQVFTVYILYIEQLVNNIIYIRQRVNNIFFVLKSHHFDFMRQCTNYTACYATKRADAKLCSVAFNARCIVSRVGQRARILRRNEQRGHSNCSIIGGITMARAIIVTSLIFELASAIRLCICTRRERARAINVSATAAQHCI